MGNAWTIDKRVPHSGKHLWNRRVTNKYWNHENIILGVDIIDYSVTSSRMQSEEGPQNWIKRWNTPDKWFVDSDYWIPSEPTRCCDVRKVPRGGIDEGLKIGDNIEAHPLSYHQVEGVRAGGGEPNSRSLEVGPRTVFSFTRQESTADRVNSWLKWHSALPKLCERFICFCREDVPGTCCELRNVF